MDLSNEYVIHKSNNGIEYLQFRKLLELDVPHAYGIGHNVNYIEINEFKNLCEIIGMDSKKIVKPLLKHTNKVQVINKDISEPLYEKDEVLNVDGLVTNIKGISLITTGADCIDMFFYDKEKQVIGNSHSGRVGTMNQIAVNTIEKMKSEYGCNPCDIIVCICPCDRVCHYNVDEETKNLFYDKFKDKSLIRPNESDESYYIDLARANKNMLIEAGVKKENIIDCKICTECNSQVLHSYRVEGKSFGKNAAIIAMK